MCILDGVINSRQKSNKELPHAYQHRCAEEYGLTGVPALVFDNSYLVMGAQPYDVLKNVVERVQKEMHP